MYALKTLSKDTIQAFHYFKFITNERSVLLKIDHPLIISMVRTYKDDDRIYFLFEHVNGTDMFEVLKRIQKMSNEQAQFYPACIVLMLEHIHRDIKPENIGIDNKGYPKLLDFAISKIISDRTTTTIGTPYYMAPEVICGKAYGPAVDLWSFGVTLYEMLTGRHPLGTDYTPPWIFIKRFSKITWKSVMNLTRMPVA